MAHLDCLVTSHPLFVCHFEVMPYMFSAQLHIFLQTANLLTAFPINRYKKPPLSVFPKAAVCVSQNRKSSAFSEFFLHSHAHRVFNGLLQVRSDARGSCLKRHVHDDLNLRIEAFQHLRNDTGNELLF